MGALHSTTQFSIISYFSAEIFDASKSTCMLTIWSAACWLHFGLVFFPQRGEVNVFASIQAAINAYSHRSLYEIDLSPLHAARMGSCCIHSCYQKLIQCVHPPQRLQPSLSRATLLYFFIPFTVAVLLLPPLGRFTEQLWHKSLPGTWVA